MSSKFLIQDDLVELNVGGTPFTTYLNTLTKIPESMLAAMFSGRFPLNKDTHGRVFIDRDPKIFRYILSYMRSGVLVYPNDPSEKKLFRLDLNYFGLLSNKGFFKALFTTLGAKGRLGPTTIGEHYLNSDHHDLVELRNGKQYFSVPRSGVYKIKVKGASGGDSTENTATHPGYGAIVTCTLQLDEGDILAIVVGQQGELARGTSNRAGGGGGGSFVALDKGTFIPLVVAGGGNGCSWGGFQKNGIDALLTKKGGDGTGGHASGRGGGGGGFKENGTTNSSDVGGLSFINGSTGGTGTYAEGGFGGGGGSMYEGGGGGGYCGGDVADTNQYNTDYPQYGSGCFVCSRADNEKYVLNTVFEDGSVMIKYIGS